jgi:N-carbamoyl-L-amino-acid hydrolase
MTNTSRANSVPEPDFALASRLFDTLDKHTRDGVGITRASFGTGEQFAHDLMTETARQLGLDVSHDAIGNLYVTLRGRTTPPRSRAPGLRP